MMNDSEQHTAQARGEQRPSKLTEALEGVAFARRMPEKQRNGYQTEMIALHDEIGRLSEQLATWQSKAVHQNESVARLRTALERIKPLGALQGALAAEIAAEALASEPLIDTSLSYSDASASGE